MIIKLCPKCGRTPRIVECVPVKKYKDGARRRLCGCPNYCSVIPCKDGLNRAWFEYDGPGDDNTIFRQWNIGLSIYESNESQNNWKDKRDNWRYLKVEQGGVE